MFLVSMVDKKSISYFKKHRSADSLLIKAGHMQKAIYQVCCIIFKSWIAGDVGVASNFSGMLFLITTTVINFQFLKTHNSFRYSKIH